MRSYGKCYGKLLGLAVKALTTLVDAQQPLSLMGDLSGRCVPSDGGRESEDDFD